MKSGSLNLLEPSGPHWACYGTPLPFTSYPCKSMHKTDLEVSLHSLLDQMIYSVFCEERITLILNI